MKNTINNYEAQYKRLLLEAINTGVYRDDRTGVGCYSIFNASLKVNVTNNFPLITGRKMFEKTFKTEFDWFINGETNIERFKKEKLRILQT